MSAEALPDLPGSTSQAGTGPCVIELLDGLLDDAGPLAGHREHRAAWYGELVGPLLVPAHGIDDFVAGLDRADHALPVILRADADPSADSSRSAEQARQQVRAARDLLADDDRVELVGVRLPLPAGLPPGTAADQLLAALDFTVPTWLEVSASAGWQDVLRVMAADGAENVTVLLRGAPVPASAELLRVAVDLDLTFRLGGRGLPLVTGPDGRYGWLNVLCATRAALNGAETPALAEMLQDTQTAPLTSALRRMSEADAAVTRAFLVAVEVDDVAAAADALADLGLLARG